MFQLDLAIIRCAWIKVTSASFDHKTLYIKNHLKTATYALSYVHHIE
jgi:hypothetical protein